jgi:hypothetical protein
MNETGHTPSSTFALTGWSFYATFYAWRFS